MKINIPISLRAFIPISLGILLFVASSAICDLCYPKTDELSNVAWHKLRYILYGIERCFYLAGAMFLFGAINIHFKHICFVALDFAIGNFTDRAFFNSNSYSWNDRIILIISLIYLFKVYFPYPYNKIISPLKDLWNTVKKYTQ